MYALFFLTFSFLLFLLFIFFLLHFPKIFRKKKGLKYIILIIGTMIVMNQVPSV